MVNKIPDHHMPVAEAKHLARSNDVPWSDLCRWANNNGKRFFTSYTATRVDRVRFTEAMRDYINTNQTYPLMTEHEAGLMRDAAIAIYRTMVNVNQPLRAVRWATLTKCNDEGTSNRTVATIMLDHIGRHV